MNNLIKRGTIVSFCTSGFILDEKIFNYLEILKEVSDSHVRISLDGSKETHNHIRNNESAYDNAIEFIKKARERNIEVNIGTTVMGQSKNELEELVVSAKSLDVRTIELGGLVSKGEAKINDLSSIINARDMQEFRKYLNKKYSDNYFFVKITRNKLITRNCGAGHRILGIKPNMDVTPCPTIDFKLGNLRSQSIDEIMKNFGSKFNDLESPCEKYCKPCKEEDNCAGCLSQALASKEKVKIGENFELQRFNFRK